MILLCSNLQSVNTSMASCPGPRERFLTSCALRQVGATMQLAGPIDKSFHLHLSPQAYDLPG